MPLPEAYVGLEPAAVWRHFADLNAIPRPSFHEHAAAAYVRAVADEHGARWEADSRGNTVVYVPAAPEREGATPVVVQAHLDMVCEKRPEVEHDFLKDPIRPQRRDGWIYATGTTLGSDNGIGAACTLALLTEPGFARGPLELLFTVEEETGLHGAANLEPSLISSRWMVNLDSEDPRVLTIGCAGGAGSILRLPLETLAPTDGSNGFTLTVSGLKGGHSGVQIHEPLANAIKLLTQCLVELQEAGVDFSLASLRGGNAHNAIPRDATATLAVSAADADMLRQIVQAFAARLEGRWLSDEQGLRLTLSDAALPSAVWSDSLRDRALSLLCALPHGVLTMSADFEGKVETSSNLATVNATAEALEIATSTRSFRTPEIERVQGEIRGLGEDAGAEIEARDGYPGWEPDPHSRLLAKTIAVCEQAMGTKPTVELIHAGLECGVIAARLPGMEAVSFGPRIRGAHTPEECVDITTVASTWKLLTALLASV